MVETDFIERGVAVALELYTLRRSRKRREADGDRVERVVRVSPVPSKLLIRITKARRSPSRVVT